MKKKQNKDNTDKELLKLKLCRDVHIGLAVFEASVSGLCFGESIRSITPTRSAICTLWGVLILGYTLSNYFDIKSYQSEIDYYNFTKKK